MPSLTLIVMAAGIGSRYGGLKQIESVGPSGEIIIEYSVYDALRAGFDKIVCIVRKDIEDVFREKIGRKIEKRTETAYVIQSLDQIPLGFSVPEGRTKPWGTAQAILACRESIGTPFVAINADDFYGFTPFETLASHMRQARDKDGLYDYGMIGYKLRNTLSDHGHVARGVCRSNSEGYLVDIRELLKVQKFPRGIKHTKNDVDWHPLSGESMTSMNFWGFTPSLFKELEERFAGFLEENADSLKGEFLIPEVVGSLVREGKARVKILPTHERWFGVTYPQDLPFVREAIRNLVEEGRYPSDLWAHPTT